MSFESSLNGRQRELPELPAVTDALPRPARQLWGLSRFWWMVLAFWIVVSLAAGLESTLLQSVNLKAALLDVVSRLAPWLFMTGAIIRVSSHCLLERGNWRRSIWIYLAVFVASLGVVALFTYFGPPPVWLGGQGATTGASFTGNPRSLTYLILARMTYQIPTFWGLVAVAHAVRWHEREDSRKLREAELNAQLTQARLHALQSQLNPHFLFNTLNSIASLVQDDPATAEQMIEALGTLLRLATTTQRQQATVREELYFLHQYLLIERIRFGDRLRIEEQVHPAVLGDAVPVLILQPLVENAIKHGVETQVGAQFIQISIQPAGAGHYLRLEVTNGGPGARRSDRKIEERVGLSNTRARLLAMFGAQASLELHPGDEGGFVARIFIPRVNLAPGAPTPGLEAVV